MKLKLKTIILLLCLAVFLAACGKKGPVRPKLQPLPAAPAHLLLEQRGAHFLLAWEIPRVNQDGSPFEPQTFRVLRMYQLPAEECPDCGDFSLVREIDLDYLQGVRRSGDRLFWWDEAPFQPGYIYRYQVLATTAGGRPGAPAQAERLFVPPLSAPWNLQATGHDRMVRLTWDAPVTGQAAGYNLYRWLPEDKPSLQAINARPVTEPTYDDFGLENGRTYLYAVSTVTEVNGVRVESLPSEPAKTAPEAGK